MSHPNAKLTEYGRLLLVSRLEEGWTQAEVAEAQGISSSTVAKYAKRYREEGVEGLKDRSSRPRRLPHALGETVIEAICTLRRELGAGPHRIAYELGMAASTVYGVLRRAGLSVLARLDRTTRAVIRYERERPGELVHLDVKKFGRIPEGGGKRFDPGFAENGAGRKRPGLKRGHDYVHVAVDDHSRFAYAEALPDETGASTAGFLLRAVQAFAGAGITVERVLTDNALNYRRSRAFADAASSLAIGLHHTQPYRPQTNGKAEAFNKTLQREWAYRRLYRTNAERIAALQPFLDDYNFVRPHTAIGNRPPASRL
ncbi:MAG: IS481 family transposase [Dehalococcoidia bacterium]|nr:IS481 family transposase [Dehalococcoidia bacterium]